MLARRYGQCMVYQPTDLLIDSASVRFSFLSGHGFVLVFGSVCQTKRTLNPAILLLLIWYTVQSRQAKIIYLQQLPRSMCYKAAIFSWFANSTRPSYCLSVCFLCVNANKCITRRHFAIRWYKVISRCCKKISNTQ